MFDGVIDIGFDAILNVDDSPAVVEIDRYKHAIKTLKSSVLNLPTILNLECATAAGVSKKLRAKCKEFNDLISTTDNEESVHQWLFAKDNWIFLASECD